MPEQISKPDQQMQFQRKDNQYFVRLEKGEELIKSLKKLCQSEEIQGGSLSAIGATSHAVLGYLPAGAEDYAKRTFQGAYEVASLTGNISQDKIHIHAILSDASFEAFGGHVFELTASPTLEIKIDTFPALTRKHDDATGLSLLNLSNEL